MSKTAVGGIVVPGNEILDPTVFLLYKTYTYLYRYMNCKKFQ